MTGRGALCVFAKVPRPGRVKTRLARVVGEVRAAALAEAFLEDTVAPLFDLPADLVVAFDEEPPARWKRPSLLLWPQGDGDLGARIERVLGRALVDHPWAIALGADSPGLPPQRVERAIEELSRTDGRGAVLGPCRDGGYYLLGVRALPAGSLRGVRWSTAQTLEDTARALALAGASTARLEEWFDVDEQGDLAELAGLIERGEIRAPATARTLEGAR